MLDISACRKQRPYSRREYLGRCFWAVAQLFFRMSPRTWFGWRRFILRLFGAKVSVGANVYPSAKIYLPWNLTLGENCSVGEWALVYNLGPVKIGDRSTVSHRAHLCAGTHNYRAATLPLIRSSISIGPEAWICSDAFIGPDVKVGEGSIVGAGSVVIRDVGPWEIVRGNPAEFIKWRRIKDSEDERDRNREF